MEYTPGRHYRTAAQPVRAYFCLLTALLWTCAPVLAQAVSFSEFPEPIAGLPQGIASGPDGALWFVDAETNTVGRITTAGVFSSFAIPTPGAGPYAMAIGPSHDAFWFTETNTGKVGRITIAGVITEYALNLPGQATPQLAGITAGKDGNLWCTDFANNVIWSVSTDGQTINHYALTNVGPNGDGLGLISPGPDGALWFTEQNTNKIGRITTTGTITEYPLTGIYGVFPFGITPSLDGALWFTTFNGNAVGRITTAGVVTNYYPVPTAAASPAGIVTGPDGALWFVEQQGNNVGRITTAGAITEYPIPTPLSGATFITLGPNNQLWFTEAYVGKIGEATLAAPLSITTLSLPNWTVNSAYPNTTLQAQGGTLPYSWSATGLPVGLSLSGSGVLAGTPTSPGTFTVNVTVTDSSIPAESAQSTYTITIASPPAITTASPLPFGVVGIGYSAGLIASSGTLPYAWSVTAGSLPAGLTLNASTGQISGTPTTPGTASFTITVTDSAAVPVSSPFSLTIYPSLMITTASPLPEGAVGTAYSQTLMATGGAGVYSWSLTAGSLPAGLSLNAATGAISGTPTSAVAVSFTVQVLDATTGLTASKAFALTIVPALVITTTSPLPSGTQGVAYSAALTANEGPVTWSLTAGTLPAGLILNTSTGQISGTPTVNGTFNFTIQASLNGTAPAISTSAAFTLTIQSALTITITTSSPLPDGTVGGGYLQGLAATGGSGGYSWTITSGSLPAGLSLNSVSGVISGTSTAVGVSTFTVQVTDSNKDTATKSFQLTIDAPLTITSSSPLPNGTPGATYSQMLMATGGAGGYSWAVVAGALPAGLSLNSATGVLSGTPAMIDVAVFIVQVTDSAKRAASKTFQLTITNALTVITGSPLPAGAVGETYSQIFTANQQPVSWSVIAGVLPAGLALDSATGQLSGTPTAAGTYNFTIQAANISGTTTAKASAPFTLTINGALTISISSPLPGGTEGTPYSQVLKAAGGIGNNTWSIISGTLPVGLSLNPATGAITGTPTVPGSTTLTVQVTDASRATANKSFTIVIGGPLTTTIPTGGALPTGVTGKTYTATVTASGGTPPYIWTVSGGSLPPGLSLNSSGQISGIPAVTGVSNVTVKVTDGAGASVSATLSIAIVAPLTIVTTTASLPNGSLNAAYSATIQASGGTPPYTWTVSAGALPAGLALSSSSGQITGKPTASGTANFTIQVSDSAGLTASQPFTVVVTGKPVFDTTTLPPPVLGTAYSFQLTASGTQGSLTWAISSGALPQGLTLSTGGLISGTPAAVGTFNFTVSVTDASQNSATQPFSVAIAAPTDTFTFPGLPATSQSQQQLQVGLALSQAYPVDLTGTLTLTFAPNSTAAVDDPAIQFSSGSRSVTFTIAAGQTDAVFAQSPLSIQTGTVAGAVTLTAIASLDGVAITPEGGSAATVTIPAEAPVITSVSIQQNGSAFNIVVVGFSNTRDLSEADFQFSAKSGSQIQTSAFTPTGVNTAFQSWFGSTASSAFGGNFQYTQPFTITSGSSSTLQSVSVTLKNSQGTSAAATANF